MSTGSGGCERTRLVARTKDCTWGFCRISDMFSLLGVPSQLTVGPTRSTSELRRWVNSLCQVTSPCTVQNSTSGQGAQCADEGCVSRAFQSACSAHQVGWEKGSADTAVEHDEVLVPCGSDFRSNHPACELAKVRDKPHTKHTKELDACSDRQAAGASAPFAEGVIEDAAWDIMRGAVVSETRAASCKSGSDMRTKSSPAAKFR